MYSEIPNTVNHLVTNGVIGLEDAVPFIAPTAHGFAPGTAPKLPSQPAIDAFINKEHKESSWKKPLFAVLVGGLALYTGIKFKGKLKSIGNFLMKPINYLRGKIPKKATP